MHALTGSATGAIPITPIAREDLAKWLKSAPAPERAWLKATGFTAEPGKFAFLPGKGARPARVVLGANLVSDPLWALAALPEALPEGSYRLDAPLEPARCVDLVHAGLHGLTCVGQLLGHISKRAR